MSTLSHMALLMDSRSGRKTAGQHISFKARSTLEVDTPHPCRLPVPEGKKTLTEGKATILHQGENVFYNPAQVKPKTGMHIMMQVSNRDLSIAVLRYFVKQRQQEIAEGILKAPRHKRTPAEAAQLKEAGGAGALAIPFRD